MSGNPSPLRRLLRRLMMLDPGYRKASFLEQKLDQKCDELRAAIEAAKPVDRTDELRAAIEAAKPVDRTDELRAAIEASKPVDRTDELRAAIEASKPVDRTDELRAAIEASKPVDRTDELREEIRYLISDLKASLCVNRFLVAHDRASAFAETASAEGHFVSYSYPTAFWHGYGSNVGDWIQTVATEQAINKVMGGCVSFQSVRRDQLASHIGGTCVMQGWYEHGTLNFMPNATTRAVWIGSHFTESTQKLLRSLWNVAPATIPDEIGCRDMATMKFCHDNGIHAYFSRCLTLTLEQQALKPLDGKVFCVDCPDWVMNALPTRLVEEAKCITQRNYQPHQEEDMRRTACAFLTRYAEEAKLVITTALHCAQPCLAMGVPVVFINPGYEEADRFSALDGLLHVYTRRELEDGIVDFSPKAPDLSGLKMLMLENLRGALNPAETDKRQLDDLRRKIAEYSVC